MRYSKLKAFTILELLVVVVILAILAVITIPNFIGTIERSHEVRELAEISSVEKAVELYYIDNSQYPVLQPNQPAFGNPTNIDFAKIYPKYISNLPHFSYWWVDNEGKIFHTKYTLGELNGNTLKLSSNYTYKKYTSDGVLIGEVTASTKLQGSEYVTIYDGDKELPSIASNFQNAIAHPEDKSAPTAQNQKPIAIIGMTPEFGLTAKMPINWNYSLSTDQDGDDITDAEWVDTQDTYLSEGNYTVKLRVQDSKGAWSDWVEKTFEVGKYRGLGTLEDPFQISSVYDLKSMEGGLIAGWDNTKCYKLMSDIDLSTEGNWVTLFNKYANQFRGTLDGNGYKLLNLTYINNTNTSTATSFIGFNHGTLKNLKLENVNIQSAYEVSGIAAINSESTIIDSYVTGVIKSKSSTAGGITGTNRGTINHCYSNVTLSGRDIGGISSSHLGGAISKCYTLGTITGTGICGGIAGTSGGTAILKDCYSTMNITTSGNAAGGIIGTCDISAQPINNTYATGTIVTSGEFGKAGGIIGELGSKSQLSNSFSLGVLVSKTNADSCASFTNRVVGAIEAGGTITKCSGSTSTVVKYAGASQVITSSESGADGFSILSATAKIQSTYTNKEWDFTNVWQITGNNYPTLR